MNIVHQELCDSRIHAITTMPEIATEEGTGGGERTLIDKIQEREREKEDIYS